MRPLLSNFSSFWEEIIQKISPLLKFQILGGGLLTHWLPMTYALFRNVRICSSLLEGNYLNNQKIILYFLFHFRNINQIWNIFEKKKIVIANVFPKLQSVKNLVRELFKKHHFRTSFESQYVKRSHTLGKLTWEEFYHFFSSLWAEMIWKRSSL